MMVMAARARGVVRNRIEAARVPGVATTDTLDREPHATHRTEAIDGLGGVAGAARMEAALRAEERADCELITANQRAEEMAHF